MLVQWKVQVAPLVEGAFQSLLFMLIRKENRTGTTDETWLDDESRSFE